MTSDKTSNGTDLYGLDLESRQMVLDTVAQLKKRLLTPEKIAEFDREEIFPEDTIREMLGPEIGLQLLMIPEEFGGLGGGGQVEKKGCCGQPRCVNAHSWGYPFVCCKSYWGKTCLNGFTLTPA